MRARPYMHKSLWAVIYGAAIQEDDIFVAILPEQVPSRYFFCINLKTHKYTYSYTRPGRTCGLNWTRTRSDSSSRISTWCVWTSFSTSARVINRLANSVRHFKLGCSRPGITAQITKKRQSAKGKFSFMHAVSLSFRSHYTHISHVPI